MTKLTKGFLYKLHKNCRIFEFLRKRYPPVSENVILCKVTKKKKKKTNPTPKPITVLQIVLTIILKNEPRIRVSS